MMNLRLSTSFLILASAWIPLTSAWGNLGHETVAFIATNFIKKETATHFQSILGDTTSAFLANVATFADEFRGTAAGKFSAPFHFIDAQDTPPSSCSVDFDRDCGKAGCVVSAIQNFTQQVQSTTLAAADVATAAKFIVHFIGDVHQPLHDEELEVGGNDIDVTFSGEKTNLHSVWDTSMPESFANGSSLAAAKSFASSLTRQINTGLIDKSNFTNGIDLKDSQATALIWASDSNAQVCTSVLPKGISAIKNVDLSGAYTQSAQPIVELQLAKAGVRLAAWLDLLATGSTSL